MATQQYRVELIGKGPLSNPKVLLENDFPVQMTTSDLETWIGETSLDVVGLLDYQMKCHGLSGTGWDFKITNKKNGKAVVTLDGTTGEKYPNMSRRFGST